MKVRLSKARMLEGFTYEPGEHEVDERTGKKLLHNFPNVCKLVDVPRADGVGGLVIIDEPLGLDFAARPEITIPPEAMSVEYVLTDDAQADVWVIDAGPTTDYTSAIAAYEKAVEKVELKLASTEPNLVDADLTIKATERAAVLAANLDINLATITGTGAGGRILVRDVRKAAG